MAGIKYRGTSQYNKPDWYWKYGLHDAQILSVSELLMPKVWNSLHDCEETVLEICLNAKDAIYERNIERILFNNYNLSLEAREKIPTLENVWWLSDTLEQLTEGKYRLSIEYISPSNAQSEVFTFEFELCTVIRNNV